MKKYVSLLLVITVLCMFTSLALSKTASELSQEGFNLYEQGKYRESLEVYKKALEQDPSSVEIPLAIGKCYYELGEYENGIKYFDKASKLDKEGENSFSVYYDKGKCYMGLNKYEIALNCFDKALDICPGDPDVLEWKKKAQDSLAFQPSLTPVPAVQYISLEMVFIQGGVFDMGSNSGENDEKPVHSVEVSSFYIGKYEVTNKEYKEYKPDHSSYFSDDNYPVECVSWNDAIAYCNWLSDKEGLNRCYSGSGDKIVMDMTRDGYRLPTEAEWEYACRAGSKKEYYWGNSIDGSYCWYSDNSGKKVHPVGQKKPNNFGLYDMSGNVWEWCWDWYGKSYYSGSPSSNPSGPSSGSFHVVRGGCWNGNAGSCRLANRNFNKPGYYDGGLGFRVVRRVP